MAPTSMPWQSADKTEINVMTPKISSLKLILGFLATLSLTGCGVAVDMSTAQELAEANGEVVPRVPTDTAIRAFDKYCYRNAGNPGRTVSALKADGYKLIVTSRRDNLFGYVHPRRPFVGVINQQFQPGCMVIVQRDPRVGAAFDRFVRSRHRDAVNAGRNSNVDQAWIVTGNPDRIFSRSSDNAEDVLVLITR